MSRDLTRPDSGDDDLYRWLIESLCLQDQQYAHEVHDGVIEVVFAYEGDLARATLLVTRRQLRHLVQSEKDTAGDADEADLLPENGERLRLQAVTTSVQEALRALQFDEPFLVLFEARFIGSTRRSSLRSPAHPIRSTTSKTASARRTPQKTHASASRAASSAHALVVRPNGCP